MNSSKKIFVSLSKLDSGNSVLETLASKLDTGFVKSLRSRFKFGIEIVNLTLTSTVCIIVNTEDAVAVFMFNLSLLSISCGRSGFLHYKNGLSLSNDVELLYYANIKKNCAELQILSFECAITRSDLLPGGITKSSLQGKLAILPTHALFDQVKIVSASPLFLPLHHICVLPLVQKTCVSSFD